MRQKNGFSEAWAESNSSSYVHCPANLLDNKDSKNRWHRHRRKYTRVISLYCIICIYSLYSKYEIYIHTFIFSNHTEVRMLMFGNTQYEINRVKVCSQETKLQHLRPRWSLLSFSLGSLVPYPSHPQSRHHGTPTMTHRTVALAIALSFLHGFISMDISMSLKDQLQLPRQVS